MAEGKKRLELTWIGKEERPRLEPRVLLEDPELSYHAPARVSEDDIFDNRLIHGDNLLALKALEQEFTGRVQCVYIDPPFNTGSAFDHYDDGLEHSVWLSLIRARLLVIYGLLCETGSIFVHLDDNEADYLKVVMDEILGRENFVGRITVSARSPSAFSTVNPGVFKAGEYILWFAKNRKAMKEHAVRVPRHPDPAYSKWVGNPDEPHEHWRITTTRAAFEHASGQRKGSSDTAYHRFIVEMARHVFRLTAISDSGAGKATVELKYKSKETPDRVHALDRGPDLDRVYILNGQQMSFYSRNVMPIDGVLTASTPLTNVWTDIAWEGIAREGGVTFRKGKKPERLVRRCLQLVTDPGDLVLDSFAGSGTTGAVAHKMGRRWIMVESGDHCLSHIVPRLKRVVDGQDAGGVTAAEGWQGGGGFQFLRLAPSLLEKDRWDNWVVSKKHNAEMLAEAMCKLEGFGYDPHPELFWMHGKSTETDFIYVTTQNLNHDQIQFISDEVGGKRTLLVCCNAFRANSDEFPNLTLKKIPQVVLGRCEWGRDDYSLNVQELSPVRAVEDADDRGKHTTPSAMQELTLFPDSGDGEDGE